MFPSNTDHSISLSDAAELTRKYRKTAGSNAVLATAFKKETVAQILEQKDCIGLRIYYGKKDNGDPTLILVGINSKDNDITDGILAEFGAQCPPWCPESNDLNS